MSAAVESWSNASAKDSENQNPLAGAHDAWSAANSNSFNANNADYGVDDSNLNCTKCGQAGHIKYDCPNENNENVPPSGHFNQPIVCNSCGVEGHMRRECPSASPQTCGSCGKEGHFRRECPDAVPMTCHGCGEAGHARRDCPTSGPQTCNGCGKEGHLRRECPDAAPMACHGCGETGHARRDCPTSGPMTCRNCGEEGHSRNDCNNARKIDRSHVPDVHPDISWEEMKTAVEERDMDDVKDALQKYFKMYPEMTYVQLHEALRAQDINLWIIATERHILNTFTNMDLQGNLHKKYTVSYRFSDKPDRPREREGWPVGDEIAARLADAGEVVDIGLPKCANCDEIGHISKWCTKERKQEPERVVVMCYNCNETGHRIRDCTVERVDRFACKNCKKSGHKAADCPEPRSAEGVECHKCNEIGHFSRDCPKAGSRGCRNCGNEGHIAKDCTEPRNMDNVQCRNCEEFGHMSRDCKKPRDWRKVICSNCGESGHTKIRCRSMPVANAGLNDMGDNGNDATAAQADDLDAAAGDDYVDGDGSTEKWNTNVDGGGDSGGW